MNRECIDKHIAEVYNVVADFPWPRYESYAVYRHGSNGKWFAIIMELDKHKFNINEDGLMTVVNLKCSPALIGSLVLEDGITRGYHMNKYHWISVDIKRVDDEKIKALLDISYNLTKTNN